MAFADYRLRIPLRVRWAEADMQGVVFNAHYLTYCDVAVIAAELIYVNADPKTKKSVPWSDRVRALIRGFERVAPEENASGGR